MFASSSKSGDHSCASQPHSSVLSLHLLRPGVVSLNFQTESMGNQPSHPCVPLDGYLAVRASIEARFPPPPAVRQTNPTDSGAGCWGGPGGEQQVTASERQQHEKPVVRENSRSSGPVLQEPASTGPVLPPTLSVAETTDSDWAPDEFEAASLDDTLGGLSQSFTRAKAPQVRAQSPLPFPSMAHCSPTVSRKAETPETPQQQVQHQREISSSNTCSSNRSRSSSKDGDVAQRTQKVYAVDAFPSHVSRPKQLDAALVTQEKELPRVKHERTRRENTQRRAVRSGDPHATGALEEAAEKRAEEAPEAHTAGAPAVQEEEHEMFCPLSPNSALGACTPSKVSKKGASTTTRQRAAAAGAVVSSQDPSPSDKNMSYGPACNHLPFLEGRALQTLLPFLFGRPLGACMGVCVHWFMKISK